MLILFDIDRTLLNTHGAGRKAMVEAGRRIFGPAFDFQGVQFSGRIDPLIVRDLLASNGCEVTDDNVTAVSETYAEVLAEHIGGETTACPGVPALLDWLEADARATLGLLTGNFGVTGAVKLAAAGIDIERFSIRVWGDMSPHNPPSRDHLPPVGMDLYRERSGRPVPPEQVTIIGDTPNDVACALASGCRALGVATGTSSVDDLLAAGAHSALPDLSETEAVGAWLLEVAPEKPA